MWIPSESTNTGTSVQACTVLTYGHAVVALVWFLFAPHRCLFLAARELYRMPFLPQLPLFSLITATKQTHQPGSAYCIHIIIVVVHTTPTAFDQTHFDYSVFFFACCLLLSLAATKHYFYMIDWFTGVTKKLQFIFICWFNFHFSRWRCTTSMVSKFSAHLISFAISTRSILNISPWYTIYTKAN